MSNEQKATQKETRTPFEGMSCASMMEKMMSREGPGCGCTGMMDQRGMDCGCANIMSQIMAMCGDDQDETEETSRQA